MEIFVLLEVFIFIFCIFLVYKGCKQDLSENKIKHIKKKKTCENTNNLNNTKKDTNLNLKSQPVDDPPIDDLPTYKDVVQQEIN